MWFRVSGCWMDYPYTWDAVNSSILGYIGLKSLASGNWLTSSVSGNTGWKNSYEATYLLFASCHGMYPSELAIDLLSSANGRIRSISALGLTLRGMFSDSSNPLSVEKFCVSFSWPLLSSSLHPQHLQSPEHFEVGRLGNVARIWSGVFPTTQSLLLVYAFASRSLSITCLWPFAHARWSAVCPFLFYRSTYALNFRINSSTISTWPPSDAKWIGAHSGSFSLSVLTRSIFYGLIATIFFIVARSPSRAALASSSLLCSSDIFWEGNSAIDSL